VDAATRGALAWTEARLALELERIRTQALHDAEELLRVAELRVRTGRADPGESALAQAIVGSAQAAVLDAEGRRFVAEAELRFSTGLPAATGVTLAGEFEAKDENLDAEALVAAARAKQPDVALSLATADRRDRAAEPTSVVLVSMLGGIAGFGPFGALLGPLIVRLTTEALAIVREDRMFGDRRVESLSVARERRSAATGR